MKKSPMKVVELFVYTIILIATIIWAVNRGGIYAPGESVKSSPPVETPAQSHETQPIDMSIYNLPPKGEFTP